jgi:hypothetical protein
MADTITRTSQPAGTKTTGSSNPLYTKAVVSYTKDSQGNVISSTTNILYDPVGNGNYILAASSTQGGKPGSWTVAKYDAATIFNLGIAQYAKAGDPILGTGALKDLNDTNSALYKNTQAQIIKTATSAGVTPAQMGKVASSRNNAAPAATPPGGTPPGGANSGGANPSATINDFNSISIQSKTSNVAVGGGDLQYPLKMNKSMDMVLFEAFEYGKKTINETTLGFSGRSQGSSKGKCLIGIQPSIADYNSVNWQGMEMNALDQALVDLSATLAQGKSPVDRTANTYKQEGGNINTAIQTWLAQEAASTKGLLPRLTGAIVNPNFELLFQGPTLRPFNFTFQMSPRSAPEATNVKKIIRFFKQNMAVQRSKTDLFLKAPNIFKIAYKGKGAAGLNLIKDCALLSFNVDYTPEGSYMTFNEDGTMVTYKLTLQFQELEPVYNDEYTMPENVIGY